MNELIRTACGAVMAVALGFALTRPVAADIGRHAELTACVSEDNAPFSASRTGGIDVDIATELARRLGRTARIVWVQIPSRGGLGKALRHSIGAGTCELFMGIAAHDGTNEEIREQRLRASVPYVSTSYVLMSARDRRIGSTEDAGAAARIGAVSATPADLHLFRAGVRRLPFADNYLLLEALASGRIDAALVWMPALARARAQGFALWPGAIAPGPIGDPSLRAEFVVGMRQSDAALAAQLDSLLAQMRGDGFVQAVLDRYGMTDPDRVP